MLMAMESPPKRSSAGRHRPARVVIIEPSRYPQLIAYLENYPVEILGLADLDLGSQVVTQAKKRGIFVTQDYPKLLELSGVDLIINLSPDKTMQMVIEQLKPEGALVLQTSDPACLAAPVGEWILNRELPEILKQLANCMSGMGAVKEALGEVLKSMIFICNARAAGLWLKQGNDFVLFVEEGLSESRRSCPIAHMGQGALRTLLEQRDVLIVKDLKAQIDFPDRDMFMTLGATGLIMVPMLKDGELTGALFIMTSRVVTRELETLKPVLEALAALITETLETSERVSQLTSFSTRDQLTGLHNEAYLQDRLEDQIAHAWRKGLSFSVVCIKVLPRKEVMGSKDIALLPSRLRNCAREIRGSLRKMDVAARSKRGDLFLILPETDATEAFEIAKRILARLHRIDSTERDGQPLTYAFGLASFPEHGTSPGELLERTCRAADRAAQEGGGTVLAHHLKAHPKLFLVGPRQIKKICPSLGEVFELLWQLREVQKESWDHASGVAYYAGRVGQSLGLDEQSVWNLQISGWLHDLGKMDSFSPKAKLSEQFPTLARVDREIHALVGAFILQNLGASESILRGVFHHHDRFDGAGKPNGLAGESIPLEGRILALANAYEHFLGQTGPSQGARQGVFSRLRELAGKSLDPQLVECLIRSEAEALDLRQEGSIFPQRKKGEMEGSF